MQPKAQYGDAAATNEEPRRSVLASGDDEGKHDVLAVDSGWLHQLVACLMVAKDVAVMAATLVYGSDCENVKLLLQMVCRVAPIANSAAFHWSAALFAREGMDPGSSPG